MSSGRQLAAIMFTDVVGYTSLMGEDEKKALQLLKANRKIHKSALKKNNGTWLKEIGDGILMRFPSASEAVFCAAEILMQSKKQNIPLRLGIHLGEIVEENGDVFGDGVNVASRIQAKGKPGEIWVSDAVANNVRNKSGISCNSRGLTSLKNVEEPVSLFQVDVDLSQASGITVEEKSRIPGIKKLALPLAMISMLLVIVAMATWVLEAENWSDFFDSKPEIPAHSVAVLPFVNMSSDAENEYFSDGLSEELLNSLANINGLHVAGRTSSFQFKGKNEDLREVGEDLGVAHILEGSVRKSGSRVRITAQLIVVRNGFHAWSETYDRELNAENIFDIQEEISRKVVSELQVKLLPYEEEYLTKRQTRDIEAYNAYLAASQKKISNQAEDIEKAIELYKEAIKIDPTYAEAYASLAMAYGKLHQYGNLAIEDARNLMRKNIDQALLLDKDLGTAYQAESILYAWNTEYQKSEASALKAAELMPNNGEVLFNYSLALLRNTKVRENRKYLAKAYELDPLNPAIAVDYAFRFMVLENKFEEALKLFDRIIELYPDYTEAYKRKSFIISDSPFGQLDQGFIYLFEAWEKTPDDIQLMGALAASARDVEFFTFSDYMQQQIKQKYPDNVGWQLVQISNYTAQGKYVEAEKVLDRVTEIYGENTSYFLSNLQTSLFYQLGKYGEAINTLIQKHPELGQDTVKVEIKNLWPALNYAVLLRKTGEPERAGAIIDSACTLTARRLEEVPEGTEPYSVLYDHIKCQAASGDFEEATRNVEILHFEQKSKANWPSILRMTPSLDALNKSAEFQNTKERMYEDLGRMRENIFNYLKENGEWKPEWAMGV